MKKDKISLGAVEENDGYVPTRSKGMVWRDEIDDDLFSGISCSVLDSDALDTIFSKVLENDRFYDFSEFKSPITIEEYRSILDSLRGNLRFFQHSSIHILQKSWELISGGGDSYAHAEIICAEKSFPHDFGRIFVCTNESSGICVFHLNSIKFKSHHTIFEWKKNVKIIPINGAKYESLMTIISMYTQARTLKSEMCLARYFEIHYEVSDRMEDE
jgi:hypothetical protein